MDKEVERLKQIAKEIRTNLIRLCYLQNIHIGGDLSIADVLTVLWNYQMKYDVNTPQNESRDRFILSKGHASAVNLFCQASIGCFDNEVILNEYATDGGRFPMHACKNDNPYVEVSTGSLGHGLSIGCGIASGLRLKGNYNSRVYVVLGDGEHGEGSIWESISYASKCRLGNLVAIVDLNGFEADGSVYEITGIGDLAEKYRSFGWHVSEFDGNCISEIKRNFDEMPEASSNQPIALICHTVKGKGISFMENNPRWHAGRINEEQYNICISELEIM